MKLSSVAFVTIMLACLLASMAYAENAVEISSPGELGADVLGVRMRMSKAQLQKVFQAKGIPVIRQDYDSLSFACPPGHIKQAGRTSARFVSDQLIELVVSFDISTKHDVQTRYAELRKALGSKYGPSHTPVRLAAKQTHWEAKDVFIRLIVVRLPG